MASFVHPYSTLTPDAILAALEQHGWHCDGRLLALASYENRVYQVGQEEGPPVVVKFYRPERWSAAAIAEEHTFAHSLAEAEIPVVAPITREGQTLFTHGAFCFAVYPRRGGRPPELEHADTLKAIGRFVARIHNVGASATFQHRPTIHPATYGDASIALLNEGGWVPDALQPAWHSVATMAMAAIHSAFADHPIATLRLHGDLHANNLLVTDSGLHIVDLDDARLGPPIQDLWLLLSGSLEERRRHLGYLLEGYEAFRAFDDRSLAVIEPLRTLRLLHYAAWLAQRWDDPAFPAAFPWFNTQRYWQELILQLREQIGAMQPGEIMTLGQP